MFLPSLKQKAAQQAVTEVFGGINRAEEISDGQFSNAMNLSTREFPMLCPRKPRGIGTAIEGTYRGMMEKNGKLVTLIGSAVKYGSDTVGITLSESTAMLPKRMVGMGAYVLIFPDKKYFNSLDITDCGSIEATYTSTGNITYTMCRLDGSDFGNVTESSTPPSDPDSGDYWIDTSSTPHKLMMYSEITGLWSQIMTVYTRISASGISDNFSAGDTVEISGVSGGSGEIANQLAALNGSQYIYDKGEDWITVLGLLDGTVTQSTGAITLKRECPDLDFVIEDSNRLWGCRYGKDSGGQMLNEIYACKLGDFRNWRVYQGTSQDSYTVSIGSDGPFTGAIAYGGMPMFFKQDCVHKIYGNKPSNYQVLTTQMHGVQRGSEKSLVIVDGTLLYLSAYGVEIYDGSQPERVSQALGERTMSAGVAGSIGGKYYIIVAEGTAKHMYVYDLKTNIWQEENAENAIAFVRAGNDLYILTEHRADTVLGSAGTLEKAVNWWAETGLQGWEQHSKRVLGAAADKYMTRFQIRAIMPEGSALKCGMRYDNEKIWQEKLRIENNWDCTRTVLMPVYPRRCDYLRMRLEGTGEIKIQAIIRNLSGGGDGRRG